MRPEKKIKSSYCNTVKDCTFFKDTATKIMAEMMGADKDLIMKKYCDKDIGSEEVENHLYKLASVSVWGSEVLCRTLNEGEEAD